MLIIGRSGWGAVPPDEVNPIPLPTPRLWVHHTATEQHGPQGMRDIQRYHMESKGWNDIAYSFVVDDDGTVYEGRGVGVAGAHTAGDNSSSHAICFMGNFEERTPHIEALNALVELARYGWDHGWWIPTLGGHRDAPGANTRCPGQNLYDMLPRARELVAQPSEPSNINPEENMTFIRKRSNGYTAMLIGGKVVPVTGPNNWAEAERGGVPRVILDDDEYDRIVRNFEVVR